MRSLLIGALFFSGLAFADQDQKSQALDKLKTNAENSKSNLDQYKQNLDISTKNVSETTAALKTLKDQRAQLHRNAANIETGKAKLDDIKKQVIKFHDTEAQNIKKEEAAIAEIKKTLEKLEANQKKRAENLVVYDGKVKEIEQEKLDWDKQKSSLHEIEATLNSQEKQTTEEHEKWLKKKQAYREETTKWEKQNQLADQQYQKIKHLDR